MNNMNNEISRRVREAYAEEAVELVRTIGTALRAYATGAAADGGECLQAAMRALHTLKGASSAAGELEIKQLAHDLEDRLRAAESGDQTHTEQADLLDALDEISRRIGANETPGEESGAVPGASGSHGAASSDMLRVKPQRIEALHALIGELVVSRLGCESMLPALEGQRLRTAAIAASLKSLSDEFRRLRRQLTPDSYQAALTTLQQVQSAVSEANHGGAALSREAPMMLAQLAAVSTSIEDAVRELRLMPVQSFFEDLAPIVREAAREAGKTVSLEISAEGAELDRAVLVRLRDPLVHILRNAVAHGIEAPGVREAAGKPAEGAIHLEAWSEGNRSVIRVTDDGGGLDTRKIKARAIAAGLIEAGRDLTDEGLLDLIATPGFSSMERADGLSGRGVGMDVAATVLDDLDGSLALNNMPGAGAVFTLTVPISASSGIGLHVRTGGAGYGILLKNIDRVVRLAGNDLKSIDGRLVASIEDEPISVVQLGDLLGVPGNSETAAARRAAVVIRSGKQRLILMVDDIPGEQSLIIKPFTEPFRGAALFMGAAVLQDNAILPVFNIPALFRAAQERRGAATSSAVKGEASGSLPTVLVVDDSITMRTLIRNVLQAIGYRVIVAHDGVAAMDCFERERTLSLVVSDLQMPRMDGAGLCRAIRASPRPNVPVVIVTSVNDAEEKRRTLEAGADAYLVKSEFEQTSFLSLVGKLTARAARP